MNIFQVIYEDHKKARRLVQEMLHALDDKNSRVLAAKMLEYAVLLNEHIHKEDAVTEWNKWIYRGGYPPTPPTLSAASGSSKKDEMDACWSRDRVMREYRTRLISDVATGQVDVRSIEIPEVAEE